MSLISSLYTGTSGLESNTQDLSIIGDNIANANTIGFKQSRAAFEDQLSQSLLGAGSVGLGTRLQLAQRIFTQGTLTSTGLSTDLALQGSGLFVVKGNHNGANGNFYTRDGGFVLDSSGFLVTKDGLRVQGYQADPSGAITGLIGDLALNNATGTSPPLATTNLKLIANLQSDAPIIAAPWDPLQASTTSNFNTTTRIFDSLGTEHQVNVYFRRTAAGAWDWHALTDGGGVTGGTAGTPTEIAGGTLTFDAAGKLSAVTQASTFSPLGANPQTLTFDFGDDLASGGTGLKGVTGFTAQSATSYSSQDGYPSGDLSNIKVTSDGTILGSFTNGQSRALGQVAVANFNAVDRLERVGGNLLAESGGSGGASVGVAGTGGRGVINSGALEQSNVDLATEFVRMIAAQRGFQANSKTINTADQLLSELIQLKR